MELGLGEWEVSYFRFLLCVLDVVTAPLTEGGPILRPGALGEMVVTLFSFSVVLVGERLVWGSRGSRGLPLLLGR